MTDLDTTRLRPTRTSTAVVFGISLLIGALLLWQVQEVVVPVLVGGVGAVCFALSLWLLSMGGAESVRSLAVSLLTVPIATGFFLSGVGTALVVVSIIFPVSDAAVLSVSTLVVIGHVGVVTGCLLAFLGLLLGIRNTITVDALARYTKITILTGLPPGVVGFVLVTTAVIIDLHSGGGSVAGAIVSGLSGFLLTPDPPQLHLASFLLVVAVAAGSLRTAVAVLPLSELLADTGLGEIRASRVDRLLSRLTAVTLATGLAGVLIIPFELGLSSDQIAGLLGTTLYESIQLVTTANTLRLALVGLTVVALSVVAISVTIRQIARQSGSELGQTLAPLIGGVVITVAGIVIATPVFSGTVTTTASLLPAATAAAFRELSTGLADVFGTDALVVFSLAILIAFTAAITAVFWGILALGYLSTETAGYSLASAGLFLGTAFAGTIDAPTWLVFGGIVGSLVVWDTGRFGTTLGREVGRTAPTQRAELVHAGGGLLVGCFGAVLALAGEFLLRTETLDSSPTTVAALAAVVTGFLCLAIALR